MKRPAYEQWIFRREDLTEQESEQLSDQLQRDPSLQQLARVWEDLETRLQSQRMVEPPAGFMARWAVRFERERAVSRDRQAYIVLAIALLSSLVFFTGFLLLLMGSYSPADLTVLLFESVVTIQERLNRAAGLLRLVPGGVPIAIPVIAGLSLLFALGPVTLLWLYSLYQFAFQGIRNGVER